MIFVARGHSSHLYLCVTTASGDVYFYTKPVPSSHYKKTSKGADQGNEKYQCETLIKRYIHKGDIFAATACHLYVALGGMDGKVSFWST